MKINKDLYECNKCKDIIGFDTSKSYEPICPKCHILMSFVLNSDCEENPQLKTEYKAWEDPNSPYYKPKENPKVECPYCKSTNTSKIGVIGRSVSFGLFGFGSGKVGKQWHCNSCKSDF